jgi:hypothetical protein
MSFIKSVSKQIKNNITTEGGTFMWLLNILQTHLLVLFFFPISTTAHIWALAYLHETLRFTSVY